MKLLGPVLPEAGPAWAECSRLLSQKRFSHYCYLSPATVEFVELGESVVFYLQFGCGVDFGKMFRILDVG